MISFFQNLPGGSGFCGGDTFINKKLFQHFPSQLELEKELIDDASDDKVIRKILGIGGGQNSEVFPVIIKFLHAESLLLC